MALTSGEDMQLAAAKNVAINAEDISAGVMGNMTVLAEARALCPHRSTEPEIRKGQWMSRRKTPACGCLLRRS
jgi:type VI secretion system secreted protein VgrG